MTRTLPAWHSVPYILAPGATLDEEVPAMPASRTLAAPPRRFTGPLTPAPPSAEAAVPDWTAISELVASGETSGRALLDGDPALGGGLTGTGLGRGLAGSGLAGSGLAGSGLAGRRGGPAAPAVLLLEPAEPPMAAAPAGGGPYGPRGGLPGRGRFRRLPLGAPG